MVTVVPASVIPGWTFYVPEAIVFMVASGGLVRTRRQLEGEEEVADEGDKRERRPD